MLFGSKDTFAIEAETEARLAVPSAVLGRMRIWCLNESFGDFENPYNALYPASENVRAKLHDPPDLWDTKFDGLEDLQIFQIFNEVIYIGGDSAAGEITEKADRYWKFDFLTNWGENFDPLKGLLAFDPVGEVLLIVEDGDDSVRGFRFPQPCFVLAASGFVRWFDSEAERLQNKAGESGRREALTPTPPHHRP